MESIDCRRIRNDFDALLAGTLDQARRNALEAHVETCLECGDDLALLQEIAAAPVEEPSAAELAAMRSAVLRTVRHEERRAGWHLSKAAAIAIAAGAGLLAAAGWTAGRATALRPGDVAVAGNPDAVLARQIQLAATGSESDSPFRYSNIRIEEREGERVHLGFDVSRHLELTLPKSDPLVTDVLVQSMLDAGSVGTQLRAIDHAGDVLEPRVRAALIQAMLRDPNLGVRLQAQAKLVEHGTDGTTADALLAVLEREESVQMRLVAIDHLTRSRVDPKRLQQAVERGEPSGRTAVRVKANDYILSF